jgi:hypothetical protein
MGEVLKEGDTIAVWWSPRRDRITVLVPYVGPLFKPGEARIAVFLGSKTGMTILNGDRFELLDRPGGYNAMLL